jgi:hypothetical protein
MAHRRLKLDQRVGLVMSVPRTSLATGTEVNVIAYGTLVPNTANVGGVASSSCAMGTIAADTGMNGLEGWVDIGIGFSQRLINGHKAMLRMHQCGVHNAVTAKIPIGTIEALVPDTKNELMVKSALYVLTE